jgi:hypothetical protein
MDCFKIELSLIQFYASRKGKQTLSHSFKKELRQSHSENPAGLWPRSKGSGQGEKVITIIIIKLSSSLD